MSPSSGSASAPGKQQKRISTTARRSSFSAANRPPAGFDLQALRKEVCDAPPGLYKRLSLHLKDLLREPGGLHVILRRGSRSAKTKCRRSRGDHKGFVSEVVFCTPMGGNEFLFAVLLLRVRGGVLRSRDDRLPV
jgi:hypothetical protein